MFIVPRTLGAEWLDFFGLGASSNAARSGGLLDAAQAIEAINKYNQGGAHYVA
ncbi:hypothetical protein [Halomonas sp. A020]|uniref:hypothetical protein n=1 Tax=Halomonas sp. A020 TaxID=2717374 RepID=UPI002492D5D2|nr:hypothetical protein [Halomonas sp. A020]